MTACSCLKTSRSGPKAPLVGEEVRKDDVGKVGSWWISTFIPSNRVRPACVMSRINWLKLHTCDCRFGGLRWLAIVNNFKNNYSQLELITWMWKQQCERTTWPHERPEAHFTSHRPLLDKQWLCSCCWASLCFCGPNSYGSPKLYNLSFSCFLSIFWLPCGLLCMQIGSLLDCPSRSPSSLCL
jgi:hypothetical protein